MGISIIPARFAPLFLGVLRIVTAFLFVQHGTAKLFRVPHVAMFDAMNMMSLVGVAGVMEIVGGLLLLVGFLTRPVAFLLSGQMAVAYFMAHAGENPLPILNKGELAVMYCFVFLYIAAAGPGRFALDRE